MCIRTRIEELKKSVIIRNIEQLPEDIRDLVKNTKNIFLEKYFYTPKLSECLFILSNNLTSPDKCKHQICNNYGKFNQNNQEYSYCSKTCNNIDPEKNSKIQEKRLLKIDFHEMVIKSNTTRTANGSWGEITARAIATRTANGWHESNKKAMQAKSPDTIRKQVAARRKTNLERYNSTHSGGDGSSKLKDINIYGFKFKNIQGYEDILIYELLLEGISPEDIEPCSRFYKHSFEYQLDGIPHRYYPDIYVKSLDKYYEAKSNYWYDYAKDIIDIKSKSVTKQFELRIYDGKYAKEVRTRIAESNFSSEI